MFCEIFGVREVHEVREGVFFVFVNILYMILFLQDIINSCVTITITITVTVFIKQLFIINNY